MPRRCPPLCGRCWPAFPIPRALALLRLGLVVPELLEGARVLDLRLPAAPPTSTCSPSWWGDRLGGGIRHDPPAAGRWPRPHRGFPRRSASATPTSRFLEGTCETLGELPGAASFDLVVSPTCVCEPLHRPSWPCWPGWRAACSRPGGWRVLFADVYADLSRTRALLRDPRALRRMPQRRPFLLGATSSSWPAVPASPDPRLG